MRTAIFYPLLALVLSGGFSAFGYLSDIPVTTNTLDQDTYVFSILTNSAPGGISFHVTITGKKDVLSPGCSAYLAIVTRSSGGRWMIGVKPEIKISLKKDIHIWKADFIVPNELLQNPDLCFNFEVTPYVFNSNSERIPITGGEIYEIKLRDFLKS
jgi:hypothetical protein